MLKKKPLIIVKLSLVISLAVSTLLLSSNTFIFAQDYLNENDVLPQDEEIVEDVILVLLKSEYHLVVGEKELIQIDEENSKVPLGGLEYDISDSSIIRINKLTREISALKKGVVSVDIKYQDDPEILASFTVSVKDLEGTVSFSNGKTELVRGSNHKLELTISPSLQGKEILWSSSNEAVISVDAQGNIKAEKIGSSVITASIGLFTVDLEIQVIAPLEAVDFNGDAIHLPMDELADIPSLIFVPYDTTSSKNASYSSSNPILFTIEDNKLVPHSVGEGYLIAEVAGIQTRIKVLVTPAKNSDGAQVLTLNKFQVRNEALHYQIDNLDLFDSESIALVFDEQLLKDSIKEHRIYKVQVSLPNRLILNDMKEISSFKISKDVFDSLENELFEVQFLNEEGLSLITYFFDEVSGDINLKYSIKEILPDNVLYSKIQTKSFEVEFYNIGIPLPFKVVIPGRVIATKPGQLHFLYKYDHEKLEDTYQNILSSSENDVSFEVVGNHQVLTFNKIAVLSNRGLIYTLGAILLTMIGWGVLKGIKRYKK